MLTSAWSFISIWYNLPFTVLLLLSIFLGLLQLIGLSGGEESESDLHHDVDLSHDVDMAHDVDLSHDIDLSHDMDLGHDVDLSHDVDLAHDVDLSHDVDMAHDVDVSHDLDMSHDVSLSHDAEMSQDADLSHSADADHAAGVDSSPLSLLAYVGVGKMPLMVVLLVLFDSIGMLGWIMNGLARGVLGFYPSLLIFVTFPVALVVGGFLTSRISRLVGHALPPVSTTATRAQAFVGTRGVVISPFVDGKYGQVHLRDSGGTLISVFAVTNPEDPIQRGEDVLLVSYDPALRHYRVVRLKQKALPQTKA